MIILDIKRKQVRVGQLECFRNMSSENVLGALYQRLTMGGKDTKFGIFLPVNTLGRRQVCQIDRDFLGEIDLLKVSCHLYCFN